MSLKTESVLARIEEFDQSQVFGLVRPYRQVSLRFNLISSNPVTSFIVTELLRNRTTLKRKKLKHANV
ncbi:hypothetical protein Mal48_26330 [Thalassoglobus polymorphus]|uniref:Uncharacterized protein n=1 Tax=Thalassoglobus polymorphus TaxID=2527994 RepID=A0A517QP03_9PLAN|nr:hypothetical protein Mal48_26330 [Thalassoglobus polymorphus]